MNDKVVANETSDADEDEDVQAPAPLKISCTATNCEDNLHCFRSTQELRRANKEGACRSCGVELVDWPRIHTRHTDDIDHTFDKLRLEFIRHHFWHVDIDQRAIDHARRKGRIALHEAAYRRLQTSVGREPNAFDGRQTPFEGNAIYYAQHATASCCRKCVEYWHGLPSEGELPPEAIEYLYQLVIRFLDERLPDLDDEGQYIPRRRT
jgi:hypothetical protein